MNHLVQNIKNNDSLIYKLLSIFVSIIISIFKSIIVNHLINRADQLAGIFRLPPNTDQLDRML